MHGFHFMLKREKSYRKIMLSSIARGSDRGLFMRCLKATTTESNINSLVLKANNNVVFWEECGLKSSCDKKLG